jgi:hypothetical protein
MYKDILEQARKHYTFHLDLMEGMSDVGEMIDYAHKYDIGMGLCWYLIMRAGYHRDEYEGGIFDVIKKVSKGNRYYFEYASDMHTKEKVLQAIAKRVELIDRVYKRL